MLRGVLALVTFLVTTPILGTLALVRTWIHPDSDAVLHLGGLWSKWLLAAVGTRPRYTGLEHVPRDRPCIFLSNHASVVDIWVLLVVVPPATRFVAKHELFRMPFLGWALSASGFVPIDRSNRTRAIASLSLAAARVRSGRPVLLFPEGTRSRDGRLQPFKKGAFHLALEAAVPVVPVSIRGSFDRIRPRSIRANPGPVDVHFHPPIEVDPYRPRDVDGLIGRVREAIEDGLRGPVDP